MKDEFASTGCRVDVLLKTLKAYTSFVKGSDGVDKMPQRASKPI